MGSLLLTTAKMKALVILFLVFFFSIAYSMNLDAKGEDLLGCKGEGSCCGFDFLRHCCDGLKCVADGDDNCMCTCHHHNWRADDDDDNDQRSCLNKQWNPTEGLI